MKMENSRNKIQPVQQTKKTGRWTTEEHELFKNSLQKYGKDWKSIGKIISWRTSTQIRSHAQKYFKRLDQMYKGRRSKSQIQRMRNQRLKNNLAMTAPAKSSKTQKRKCLSPVNSRRKRSKMHDKVFCEEVDYDQMSSPDNVIAIRRVTKENQTLPHLSLPASKCRTSCHVGSVATSTTGLPQCGGSTCSTKAFLRYMSPSWDGMLTKDTIFEQTPRKLHNRIKTMQENELVALCILSHSYRLPSPCNGNHQQKVV